MLAILNHLWQSTLFAAVAGLLTLAVLRNGAHVRYALWYAASLKFLIPFSVLVGIGGHFAWTRTTSPVVFPDILDRVAEPFATTPATLPVGAMKVLSPQVASIHLSPTSADNLRLIGLGIWAFGALMVVICWLLRWRRIRAAVRSSVQVPMDAPVPVRSSQYRVEPGVVGLFRPVLLLPARIAEQLSTEQLQAIVAHEVCHIRRRDNLAAAIHMLVEALFWFYPLVWWLGRRLVAERESACDESVIAAGNDREAYATGILQVCRYYLESPLICAAGVSGADLKRRIRRIMTPQRVSSLNAPRKLLLTAVAAAAVVIPIAIGSAFAAAPQANPKAQQRIEPGELLKLLTQGKYAELDQRMNGFQQAYESHELNEDGLLRAFAVFDVATPGLEESFNAWVVAFPKSYAARLARGGYYFVCGSQTRGTRAIDHTTQAQLNGMNYYYGKAQQDLRASLSMDAKPLLSYNLLIRIDQKIDTSTQQSTRALLNAALKIDPRAMSVRRAYMRSLQTRWGGSLNEMQAFMQETKKAGFSDDQLWTLEKLIDEEHRWLARAQGTK